MFAQATASGVVSIAAPARYLVIDIETGDAPEAAISAALEGWRPPANVKDPAKIADRQSDAAVKIRDRSALLDAAPLLCIGTQTERGGIVFNGMDTIAHAMPSVQCMSCGTDRDMLLAFRQWLDLYTSLDTVLVGHNIKAFDLPKLRSAYTRHKLKLPTILAPRILNEALLIVDTAQLFRSYSVEHREDFCPSLSAVCTGLDIPKPKAILSGAEVPRLHREGKYAEILTYNAIDVAATARAYLLMTGQADDLL